MRQGYAESDPPAADSGETEEPLASISVAASDHAGRKRRGRAVLLPRWQASRGSERLPQDEEFRIVVLAELPDGPLVPRRGVVVSAPARPLASAASALREATATYSTGRRSSLPLAPEDLELLRQGSLIAATPLGVSAEEIFAGGKARLTALARDLLASTALAEQLDPISVALSAPDAAKPPERERLEELKELVESVSGIEFGDEQSDAKAALKHLSELVFADGAERLLAVIDRVYPEARALMGDIYMMRAFRRDRQEASELLAMQRFLRQAVLPPDETELSLDRSLAAEQLSFATLIAEPQRTPPAKAMFDTFRRKYISHYREHHTQYWAEVARLHARLREEEPHADALRRVNTVAELGPPVGVGALAAYEELVAETAGCPLITGVEEMLGAEAVCPACGLSMEQVAPVQRVEEIISRIERASGRQMARLSSSAVQQVLRRSNDARVDQFLKMVQASQLTSLHNIIDDELVGYLRRFLVECRIEEALQPILNQLQEGMTPKVGDAQTAMREVSQVLQRAFQAAQRALPPGETPAPESQPQRRKRKR